MSTASLLTLGRFELRVDGRLVPPPPTRKARALIAYLIAREGRDVSREQLVEIFWPQAEPEGARRSLNTALSSIRGSLRSAGVDGTAVLQGDKAVVKWTARSTTDHLQLRGLAARTDAQSVSDALELYRGEFLEGDYDEWTVAERARIAQEFEKLLAAAVRNHASVPAAKALVAIDPYDEAAAVLLIESELNAGRRGVAASLADACRRAFEEAHLELSPSFVRRFGALGLPKRGDVAAPVLRVERERQQPARAAASAISAPAYAHRFVGRELQLDALLKRLNAAHERFGSMVLIVGEAGIGKTRLVRELCASCAGDAVVAVGQCAELSPSPFAPFAEALRSMQRADPHVLARDEALAAALHPFAPQVAAEAPSRGGDERQTIDAFAEVFTRYAAHHTVVVVLEDLQWADAASLRLLVRLRDRISSSRLFFIATHRVGEPDLQSTFATALSEIALRPATWRVTLQPLDRRAMTEMLRAVMVRLAFRLSCCSK